MAQFTFLELHFEEDSIPGLDGLGSATSDDSSDESGSEADASGRPILQIAVGIGLAVAAVAIVRQLLAEDTSPVEGADALEAGEQLDE
ncbi:hypothetical protein Hrd1104_03580 [Halorhabdus sp. CBA1104]|uniref:hypothetical protein n=1 Tax=unclassified Halorhabdus TaxID=2621901 RepID=UPI0012B375C0|nr:MULTISPECIES: hypothetical protein [unclassified Halorhabdus]QGN06464.1 hypothetical protein Hrd1104_03580 [Halorhabdus sp. CBA1104]